MHALGALGVALGPESSIHFSLQESSVFAGTGAWLVVRAPILLSKFYAG